MTKWKGHKPPKKKKCTGCGRTLSYEKDYYHFGRERVDGTLAWYAIQPCIECRAKRDRRKPPEERKLPPQNRRRQTQAQKRQYQREFQRMKSVLTKGKRMEARVDTPVRRVRVSSKPFLKWYEHRQEETGRTGLELCEEAGVSERTIHRARTEKDISIDVVEKFFLAAGRPQLLAVMYDGAENYEGRDV